MTLFQTQLLMPDFTTVHFFLLSYLLSISKLYTQYSTTMATTTDDAMLPAALLLVDSTTKKKKKTSVATTTSINSILQQQLNTTADTSSDMALTPLYTFAQAVKELNDAQEAGEDSKEVLT